MRDDEFRTVKCIKSIFYIKATKFSVESKIGTVRQPLPPRLGLKGSSLYERDMP